ncbi:cytochrome oxidase c subunit VIb-domain-containing protein [Catenaria anguillulae PL171]|uniref:Cytochrome oxidase c subunit VIb-domain-containing protein n=1 Tax=Catenaria anguillulae PL171 TaxID=765915 RepID=A0A1Y2HJW2_9FUNG|nr:cytochrome oxidase c subunit VIb-domain-containing protein [Catenaria anguillulae PL171]
MGWFSSSSSAAPASTTDPAPAAAPSAPPTANSTSFPDRSKRKICWDARDAYLTCLDRSYGVDAPSVDPNSACVRELAEFQKVCPTSWVKHFINKREGDIRDRKLGLKPPKPAAPSSSS